MTISDIDTNCTDIFVYSDEVDKLLYSGSMKNCNCMNYIVTYFYEINNTLIVEVKDD